MYSSSSESRVTLCRCLPARHLATSASAGEGNRLAPARPRGRRSSRVLYPPPTKRILPGEAPDTARRWLLLLSALLFLQIYTEETSCGSAELLLYSPEASALPQSPRREVVIDADRQWAGTNLDEKLRLGAPGKTSA
ncbi:hypothetical protein DPEC_G00119810 [Dallia pectoralis]|uniref:Uncharacterized protein n=1 Tax=Dallia pectoralis TaxID=75939 RepID=A0ACC2GQ81_DALPE|nr:hypothetical protein DPEC_G00119810 [Dallia pectoralis]